MYANQAMWYTILTNWKIKPCDHLNRCRKSLWQNSVPIYDQNSSKSGHPCFGPDLLFLGECFQFFTTENVCCNLIIYGLYYVKVGSFYVHFLKPFNPKWVLNFVKGFFCIYWDYHMVLSFNLLIWCITLTDLHILKNPCVPGINPSWSWCMSFWYVSEFCLLKLC